MNMCFVFTTEKLDKNIYSSLYSPTDNGLVLENGEET